MQGIFWESHCGELPQVYFAEGKRNATDNLAAAFCSAFCDHRQIKAGDYPAEEFDKARKNIKNQMTYGTLIFDDCGGISLQTDHSGGGFQEGYIIVFYENGKTEKIYTKFDLDKFRAAQTCKITERQITATSILLKTEDSTVINLNKQQFIDISAVLKSIKTIQKIAKEKKTRLKNVAKTVETLKAVQMQYESEYQNYSAYWERLHKAYTEFIQSLGDNFTYNDKQRLKEVDELIYSYNSGYLLHDVANAANCISDALCDIGADNVHFSMINLEIEIEEI